MIYLSKGLLIVITSIVSLHLHAYTSEIITIKLNDGETVTTRLCLPETGETDRIVIAVHGTGPFTYLTQRVGFNYYDVLAEGFCNKGAGFFTYNRRGVDLGTQAPWFDSIDSLKFAKYQPSLEAEDIESMITFLKNDIRFRNSKIILYGISEGTIIASIVAERKNVEINALLLHGYAHDSMYEIIKWQNEGNGMMILINSIFDKNGDKMIDREEYEIEEPIITSYRSYLFNNLPFDSANVIKDNAIDIQDISKMREPIQEILMNKIVEHDQTWIWNNYFRVPINWFKKHFALEPNKTRLLRVDIPIYLFHGKDDINVPFESTLDLQDRFEVCGKDNLKVFLFDRHNHDLNFEEKIQSGNFSEGLQKLFDTTIEI